METIVYLVVGGKIKPAQARIVGKIAEVRTEYGIREFGGFHLTEEDARRAIADKRKTNVELTGVPPTDATKEK